MKLPKGKRVADLTSEERQEAEAQMETHIEAYEKIAKAVQHAVADIAEVVSEAAKNDASGLVPIAVALDPLAVQMLVIAKQIEEHSKADAAAYQDGLEGLERLGQDREREEKESKSLAEAGLGEIIRPAPPDPE